MKAFYALAGAVLLLTGCGNDDARPKNPIPANSAALLLDGVAWPVDASRSDAKVEARTNGLTVTLRSRQSPGAEVGVYFAEFAKRPGLFDPQQVSFSDVHLDETSAGGVFHRARNCFPTNLQIEVTEYDENKRTISGKFSGLVCRSQGASTGQTISNGEFNLPYTVQ